jgi:hypothetical protein
MELYNSRDIPYGFRHKSIPGYADGFPYFFDINLSADEAQRWIDFMNYGLMIDDVKTQRVTAQIVVYNAELGYFGNVMVFFEFTEVGWCKLKSVLKAPAFSARALETKY